MQKLCLVRIYYESLKVYNFVLNVMRWSVAHYVLIKHINQPHALRWWITPIFRTVVDFYSFFPILSWRFAYIFALSI